MKLSEIRATLLEEHERLRELIGEVLVVADGWRAGDAGRDDVLVVIDALSTGSRAHNAREEALLRGVVPTLDAWGPVRADVMLEEHVQEHEDMLRALAAAGTELLPDVAVAVLAELATRMLSHMDREEQAFLGADFLRDDEEGLAHDAFGG
jgi:hemerythrin-like domain-containing protein